MKYAVLIILLLVVACQPAVDSGENTHIGCQEGEITDGVCTPAGVNDAETFQGEGLSITTQWVDEPVRGYIARPALGNYPGVIMIHEWWGLNENIEHMAEQLAGEGYVVYAVDLYDGEVADTSEKALKLAKSVRENPEEALQKMQDAVVFLQDDYDVKKIGSLGWSFGGQQSLQLSLNEELDATVIYYGNVIDDKDQLQFIDWPVLGIFGEQDTSISVESVESFESSLNELGIENEIVIYPGVGHAFANPTGSNYAASETKDAWDTTLSFLSTNLGYGPFLACGCGCCPDVEPQEECLYRSQGDDMRQKRVQDMQVRQTEDCDMMGCSAGIIYTYCD